MLCCYSHINTALSIIIIHCNFIVHKNNFRLIIVFLRKLISFLTLFPKAITILLRKGCEHLIFSDRSKSLITVMKERLNLYSRSEIVKIFFSILVFVYLEICFKSCSSVASLCFVFTYCFCIQHSLKIAFFFAFHNKIINFSLLFLKSHFFLKFHRFPNV